MLAAWGGGGRCLFGLSPPGVRVGAPRLWAHPLLARDSSSSGSHAEYSPDPFASSWTGLERLRAWEPAACRFSSQFESKLFKLILLLKLLAFAIFFVPPYLRPNNPSQVRRALEFQPRLSHPCLDT